MVRKGLYAAVAGARPPGTTNLLEDIAVPPEVLTDTVRELGGLFEKHGYADAVTFGHARDANLHFMITPHLDDPRAKCPAAAAYADKRRCRPAGQTVQSPLRTLGAGTRIYSQQR